MLLWRFLFDRWLPSVGGSPESNISTCSRLGCQWKLTGDLCTFFSHPATGQRVYVMMNACHMLKLNRNMLQGYLTLVSHDGVISWSVIKHLSEIQEDEGLWTANKISSKHMNFATSSGMLMSTSVHCWVDCENIVRKLTCDVSRCTWFVVLYPHHSVTAISCNLGTMVN